jgi:hypothetical protein
VSFQRTDSKRAGKIADGLATLVNDRSTDLTKFQHRVKSIGRRVRRVAIDLANDKMMACPPGVLE